MVEGAHIKTARRIQRGGATDLTDSVCTTKKLYEPKSEDFAFAILGLPYNSQGNTIPLKTIQAPIYYQEQFRSDLGYTGQPRSHLLMAAVDPTAAAVKGSTTSRGNQ